MVFRLHRSADTKSLTAREAARVLSGQLSQFIREVDSKDEILVRQARFRLEQMSAQLDELLRQELTFTQTETWRTVYQAILSKCRLNRYLSVALIEHEDYWRDQPGKATLEFNYDLVAHGVFVHRRFIIDEFFWPPRAVHPANEVLSEIIDQATRGIEVDVVRKSALENEPRLVRDFGIYGSRAVGYQSLDDLARTTSFVLRFGKQAVEEAEEVWRQLDLYAIPLVELLDRPA